MASADEHKKAVESYIAALCAHNIDGYISHYDPECEVTLNGQVVIRSRDELKTKMEQRLSNPDYKVYIIEFLPIEGDDCVRFIVEDTDKSRKDETCIFSKEGKIVQQMITILGKQ
ncbi:unnamed protein product [Adineta ricciae]|uniref:SnoaL-like domain-containing protein n=1 Tax=Adineta ricciae TaxID=249248 RepID=A0A816F8R0_ADIRI|nr:unnamed protein product [Adineta ricciae]CAF1659277.1 unnamed protein product [Adineta ricciae]